MTLIRKQYDAKFASINEADHTVTAIVSTDAIDRDKEVIVPSAFASSLTQYMRNPVHGWAHDYSRLDNILGRAIDAQITSDGLQVTFKYAVNTPAGALAWQHIVDGNLSSYSVGFIGRAWAVPDDQTFPQYKNAKKVWTEVSLVEIALCGIPSNPEALVVGRQLESEPERSKSMNPHLNDAVARLRAAADNIEANGDAESVEAISAVCTSVAHDLLSFSAGQEANEEHEQTEPAEEAAAEEEPAPEKSADVLEFKSGAVLSSANRKRLNKIYKTCKEAMEACKEMAAEAGHDPEADEEDKSGDGRDNGDGVGATNHEPTPEEQNAGKSFDLAAWWDKLSK